MDMILFGSSYAPFFASISALFQLYGHTTSLLQLEARHGFTNPAQVHNDNPAFGYHAASAQKAWRQALALLARTIGRDTAR
jgi:dienelactone hydrolase